MKKSLVVLLFLLVLPGSHTYPQDSGLIAPGAELEKLSGGFSFTEGPASDREGNVFFTDQPNNRIMKWSVNDLLTTWMKPCGRSNGLTFDSEGYLWSCADEKNALWRIHPDRTVAVLLNSFEGNRLNGPNDLWIHPDGGIYFSDPFYKRPWWDHDEMPQDGQYVYYLTPGRAKLIRLASDLVQPNGIIGTLEGSVLYITDIGDKKTYSYTIKENGTLENKKLFCDMGSDGMTIDDQGNVYLTGNGVFIFNSAGEQIEHLNIPERWTANVCFGGKDMNDLFITASKGLYRIKMNVKGVGSQ
jgi:gluconolactonase